MTATYHTEQTAKTKGMLLLLPLILFPFLTLLFWAGDGGKGTNKDGQNNENSGLNMQLPDARLKSDKGDDKLSFYQQASNDSVRKEEERRNDPFWNGAGGAKEDSLRFSPGYRNEQKNYSIDYNPLPPSGAPNSVDENEAKVYQKLAKLNSALAQSRVVSKVENTAEDYRSGYKSSVTDTKKLETMMRAMNENNSKDPELDQLNTMLDKIASIQHPEGGNNTDNVKDTAVSKIAMAIHNKKKGTIVSLLQRQQGTDKQQLNTPPQKAGFYNDEAPALSSFDAGKLNTFGAIIPETQSVVSGSTVQLQFMQDIDLNGISITKGSYLFGVANLSNERLQIKISSIRNGNSVYPVALDVYDMDGLAGIYVPGSIGRETAKQSADRAINGIGLGTLDPSLGAQAASAGIETMKSFIGKKTKLIRVTLPAGYQVLLKDNHSN